MADKQTQDHDGNTRDIVQQCRLGLVPKTWYNKQ